MQNNTELVNMTQDKPKAKECPICMTESEKIIRFPCSHFCCSECWKQIIKAANSNFQVHQIQCFDLTCKKKIDNPERLISMISDKDIANRFNYLKKKKLIQTDKHKFMCPNQACSKVLDDKDQEAIKADYKFIHAGLEAERPIDKLDYSFLVCDDCQTVFCKICEVFHEPGKAKCKVSKKETSEKIIKVRVDSEDKSSEQQGQQALSEVLEHHIQNGRVQSHDMSSVRVRILLAVHAEVHEKPLSKQSDEPLCQTNVHAGWDFPVPGLLQHLLDDDAIFVFAGDSGACDNLFFAHLLFFKNIFENSGEDKANQRNEPSRQPLLGSRQKSGVRQSRPIQLVFIRFAVYFAEPRISLDFLYSAGVYFDILGVHSRVCGLQEHPGNVHAV